MKITLINIANKMPGWVLTACNDYLKRINHSKYSCQIIEIKADKNPNKSALSNMEIEAKKIASHIPKDSFVITLDEHGKNLTSTKLAEFLQSTALNHRHLTFIIGGADGIHPELKAKANYSLSLSTLVFPHALVRIIILEQIYRAISILEGHPYHRE